MRENLTPLDRFTNYGKPNRRILPTDMFLFASTITVSAFLLFLVQPIIAKQILPWFGGTSAVWTTCMVFFQVLLLAGYAYAHGVSTRLSARTQARVHIGLLLVSLVFLPITAREWLKPTAEQDATWAIVVLLAVTIGLPYFLLSTTGPLLQKWVAPRFAQKSVYRLFALSNLGSLLGLLAFPFAIEPFVSTRVQSWAWSAAYALFVLTSVVCTWKVGLAGVVQGMRTRVVNLDDAAAVAQVPPPTARHYLVWWGYSALGSVLLLASTSHMTQNIASVPFLWVLPLTLYLLTFVVVFEGRGGRGWYTPRVWLLPVLLATVAMAAGLTSGHGVLDVGLAVPLYCVGLFITCVFCHGELARRKPASRYLTHFYLSLAGGGALGGLLVGLAAPHVFDAYYELPLALFAVTALALPTAWHLTGQNRRGRWVLTGAALAATVATAALGFSYVQFLREDVVVMQRNFYGTLRVKSSGRGVLEVRRLLHGVILHGEQYVRGPWTREPGTYYTRSSGLGLAIATRQALGPVRLGVVGLGVGTTAAYGREGDHVRFYELDPDVLALARTQFTYLRSSAAQLEFVLGDARLSLERELKAHTPQRFDVLAIDAFSSDSIPVHLITREAVRLYMQHLAPDGVLAVHVSNRFLDLKPVLAHIAQVENLHVALVDDEPEEAAGATSSEWVLLAATPRAFADEALKARIEPMEPDPHHALWTDQFNNLLDVLKVQPREALKNFFKFD